MVVSRQKSNGLLATNRLTKYIQRPSLKSSGHIKFLGIIYVTYVLNPTISESFSSKTQRKKFLNKLY